ncbi:MAG: rubrerythrin-like domain-containing protein [Haloplanus sp.]
MSWHDPYAPGDSRIYECVGCGGRMEASAQPVECPDCGETVLDISVPRPT